MVERRPLLAARDLNIYYGSNKVLGPVNLEVRQGEIFAIIGPANSGKTSFLRVINRMDTFTPGLNFNGSMTFDGHEVSTWRNLYSLRRRIRVVFPAPYVFPSYLRHAGIATPDSVWRWRY